MEKFQEIIAELNAMPMNDVNLYIQYAKVNNMFGVLKERKEELGALIVGEMQLKKELKKEFEFGKFTVASRETWEYSDDLKAKVDKLKTKEEKKGIAIKKVTNYLKTS